MVIGAAELKIGFDVFSKILDWTAKHFKGKNAEKLKSQAYQELLKGDHADLDKVAAILKTLSNGDDFSGETQRLSTLFKGSARVAKKPAAMKSAAPKKPTAMMAAPKKKPAAAKRPAATKKPARKKPAAKK